MIQRTRQGTSGCSAQFARNKRIRSKRRGGAGSGLSLGERLLDVPPTETGGAECGFLCIRCAALGYRHSDDTRCSAVGLKRARPELKVRT